MKDNTTSYIAGLTHPSSWIHDKDQLLLVIGMGWWYGTALIAALFFVCAFSRMHKRPMLIAGAARIMVLCAMLGVAYMYTGARELLFLREDGVFVRTPLVVMNGCIQVLLIYVGSLHCVLHPTYDRWVLWLGGLATFQTTLASFIPAVQQWPGWIVGACFYIPIPFIWISQQRRTAAHRPNVHVVGWTVTWLCYRTAYALVQLTGHTFASKHGLETTAELSLIFVLNTATMFPLLYAFYFVQAPPHEPGKFSRVLSNGDRLNADVSRQESLNDF